MRYRTARKQGLFGLSMEMNVRTVPMIGFVNLYFTITSISGLVAEYIVAIDVTRVRFPADAFPRKVAAVPRGGAFSVGLQHESSTPRLCAAALRQRLDAAQKEGASIFDC